MLSASIDHLGCAMGALLIPHRRVRLLRVSNRINLSSADEELRRLEVACLDSIRHTNQPMLSNQGRSQDAHSSAWRHLIAPIGGNATAGPGALLLLRSTDDPAFNSLDLAIVKHLGHYFSSLLDADVDSVTGLYTRLGLQQHVETAEPGVARTHAVLCIDIDRLHVFNKVGGFEAGDAVITRVARLLREPPVPAQAAAARISGNEFVLVLPDANTEDAEVIASALQRLTAHLANESSVLQPLSLSCGIASFGHSSEFQRGLVLAELACQMAKDRGRDRVEVYQDNDASMIRRHTDILAFQQLREALQENRLTLFAQRIMPLQHQKQAGGYELLLRLTDRPEENKAPGALLAVALRTELATELDLWVVEHAINAVGAHMSLLLAANVSLSINLAGPSLTDDKFLERVRALISSSGIPPGLIMFEVTETVALLSLTKAVRCIQELRALGCRFALDDFGTGVNSLKNLTHLPMDRVKIDGSFVSDILTNPQSVAIVRAIVTLARDLGIDTVAEYAETEEIIQRLRELGVEYAQGYGVEKPCEVARVFATLQARQTIPRLEVGGRPA
jgi:diguanylate cyclase (GGDEF)-like protein